VYSKKPNPFTAIQHMRLREMQSSANNLAISGLPANVLGRTFSISCREMVSCIRVQNLLSSLKCLFPKIITDKIWACCSCYGLFRQILIPGYANRIKQN